MGTFTHYSSALAGTGAVGALGGSGRVATLGGGVGSRSNSTASLFSSASSTLSRKALLIRLINEDLREPGSAGSDRAVEAGEDSGEAGSGSSDGRETERCTGAGSGVEAAGGSLGGGVGILGGAVSSLSGGVNSREGGVGGNKRNASGSGSGRSVGWGGDGVVCRE